MELYQLLFPNGKRYIGISRSAKTRFTQHRRAASKGSELPVHRAIRKHGWEHIKPAILVIGPTEYIRELEAKVIDTYCTTQTEFGYNVTSGGEVSPMLTESVRLKIVGRTKSEQTKRKISETNKLTMATPQFRKYRSIVSLSMQTQEMNKKKSDSVKAAYADPEVRKRHSDAMRRYWAIRNLENVNR